jgi:glycosyltransferase involved in cell wall biosynthesis
MLFKEQIVMNRPQITVLMPVYNGEKYLREAIESILAQTFSNYEFLIINDGSADQSVNIITAYDDPRIKLVHNDHNTGIVSALNKGLDLARGELIARMDSDDISRPERLFQQQNFMALHPDVGVCGTWIEYLETNSFWTPPTEHNQIKARLLIDNPLAHPTVMIRTDVLRKHHLYYQPLYYLAEDYELWTRMAELTRLANIPQPLLKYRLHSRQLSRENVEKQREMTLLIQEKLRSAIH